MSRKLIVIIGLVITILLLSGCFDSDRNGMIACKASYDNLVMKEGYEILGHQSDFLCCVENRFTVSYMVSGDNRTFWIHGFVYDSQNDNLYYDYETLPDCVLEIK